VTRAAGTPDDTRAGSAAAGTPSVQDKLDEARERIEDAVDAVKEKISEKVDRG
jgi:hypothetical protein